MNISSMTGFVRQDGLFEDNDIRFSFIIEIKSVNAKGLEIKTKLPQGFDELDCEIKNKISRLFTRGTFNLLLNLKTESSATCANINTALLDILQSKAAELYDANPNIFSKPSPAELLKITGVVEKGDISLDEKTKQSFHRAIFEAMDIALDKLKTDRLAEGQKMTTALLSILSEIDLKRQQAEEIAAGISDEVRQKIIQQLQKYTTDIEISPDRLEQEILFYVMRADVQEELDRLKAHISTAREIFKKGGQIGRRLDFLCQELNREANTLCSKSMNLDLTKIGMDLKALIEQFREQTQNME